MATGGLYLNCSSAESGSGLINKTDPVYFSYRNIYMTILFTMGTCGILMNLSMICVLLRWRAYQKTALGLLFLQLFVSNLSVAVFCLMVEGIWNLTVQWYGGDFLCRIVKFLQMFSSYATTFILTSISIETCVTLTFPLTKSKRQVTFFRVKLFSTVSWIFASLSSIPQAVIFHVLKAPVCEEFYQCVTHESYSHPSQELAYKIGTMCLIWLLPLAVMIFCYMSIVVTMSKEARMVLKNEGLDAMLPALRQGTRVYQKTRRISLWMTFITATTFVICWAPYYTIMFAHHFKSIVSDEILRVISYFGSSFTVISPIIFASFILQKGRTKDPQEILQLRHAGSEISKHNHN